MLAIRSSGPPAKIYFSFLQKRQSHWTRNSEIQLSPSSRLGRVEIRTLDTMTSLKRAHPSDGTSGNLSSKVYVRTTRAGKVQKIVRELYLRQDIPCSSKLCRICLSNAPTNYHSKREAFLILVAVQELTPIQRNHSFCPLRQQEQNHSQMDTTWSPIPMLSFPGWTSSRLRRHSQMS